MWAQAFSLVTPRIQQELGIAGTLVPTLSSRSNKSGELDAMLSRPFLPSLLTLNITRQIRTTVIYSQVNDTFLPHERVIYKHYARYQRDLSVGPRKLVAQSAALSRNVSTSSYVAAIFLKLLNSVSTIVLTGFDSLFGRPHRRRIRLGHTRGYHRKKMGIQLDGWHCRCVWYVPFLSDRLHGCVHWIYARIYPGKTRVTVSGRWANA